MGAYLCIASNDVPPAVSKRITLNINCKFELALDVVLAIVRTSAMAFFTILVAVKRAILKGFSRVSLFLTTVEFKLFLDGSDV